MYFFRTPKVLIPLLSELFPFFNKDVYIQECYVKNLLQITHYLPNMRQKIMEIVIERLIKFDVSIAGLSVCCHFQCCLYFD